MNWIAKKRLNSVLGLNLNDGQLRACHVARVKGALSVVKATTGALSRDLSLPEVGPGGREIKKQLDAAGIRERHCVVAIPASWVMCQQTKLPELSPADVTSFLQLEAEKGFPCDPSQLQIWCSFCRFGEVTYATQLAVRKDQIERLAAVLRAAGLKPLSFSLGLTALPEVMSPASDGRITLAIKPAGAAWLVSAGGGIASFRTCQATVEAGTAEHSLDYSGVARELRITFEQFPAELRAQVQQLRICGDKKSARQLAESLGNWAASSGLTVERDGETASSLGEWMAECIATRWLENGTPAPEFLPPLPSRWSVLLARSNSKRLTSIGFAVAGTAALALGAFGWQALRLWSLNREWSVMRDRVTELEGVQSLIREYRPWYDTSFRHLSILRRVTESFPDNGSVTAKSFEIHGPANVSITGTARDNTALLHALDQLRKTKEIQGLKVEQIRGRAPLQFTLSFRWDNISG